MRVTRAGVRVSVLRIALVVLPVVVLATGCHVPGTGASGAAPGSGTITVAVVRGIDNAPLAVAVKEGLFRQQGLNVTIEYKSSLGDVFQALTSGQAQIAGGDYTGFFYEEATGPTQLQFIADGYDAGANSIAILTSSTTLITTPQQLEEQSGQSVAVATPYAQLAPYSLAVPYSIQTLAAEEVLQNDGVSPSSVDWKQVPAGDMIAELRTGQVKAILATEPYIVEAEQQLGAVDVMDASAGVTSGLPMSGYFSLASYGKANASAVRAFQQSLDQAQADCAQRGVVQSVLPDLVGMSAQEAALATLGTYPTSLNVGQVQRVAELMYDSGMISNQLNVSASGKISV
jgi:NitT/TauT family transport system substrate-binding protein